jgi:hypothetical protein
MSEIQSERVVRGHQRLTDAAGKVVDAKWDKHNWQVFDAEGKELGRARNVAEAATIGFGEEAVLVKAAAAPKAEKPAAAPKPAGKKATGKKAAAAAAPPAEPEPTPNPTVEPAPAAAAPKATGKKAAGSKKKETAPVTEFEEPQTINDELQAIMEAEGHGSMAELAEMLGVGKSVLYACAKSGEPTDKLRKAIDAYRAGK